MKKIMKRTMLLLTVGILGVFMTGCGGRKVTMDQILSIYWQGANGEGNAYVEFNETELSKAISGCDANDLNIPYEQRQEAYDKLTKFENNFTWSVDPQAGLSNGDKVSITVNYSKEMTKDLGISIETKSGKTFTKTVEDLPEAVLIDAFANYTPEFEGMSPCASFKSTTVSMNGAYVTYKVEDTTPIKVGDTITVRASYTAHEGHYKLKEETKEYTVDKIDKYLTKNEEISEDTLNKMKQEAQDEWDANYASNWDTSKEKAKAFTYIGNYFLTAKDPKTFNQNLCFLVYKVDVKNDSGSFSYYTYYKFTNLVEMADGTQSVDLSNCDSPSGSLFGPRFTYGDFYYGGYEKLDSLFNKEVVTNAGDYTYETTIKEEKQ